MNETCQWRLDDACADLPNTWLAVGDARIDDWYDASFDDAAHVDTGRHARKI